VKRVLVIDDERVIRDLMREILERAGHETLGAGTAQEALALLEDEEVGVVVSDIVMPGLTGLELLEEVHARRPTLPVILVTGAGTYENLSQAVTRGADGLVIKPFSHADLQTAVASVLERSRLRANAGPLSKSALAAELETGRGRQWDPAVVDAALADLDQLIHHDTPTQEVQHP
jgi:two-component system, NtrC family, nitrogen regulation response regulator NtrX